MGYTSYYRIESDKHYYKGRWNFFLHLPSHGNNNDILSLSKYELKQFIDKLTKLYEGMYEW